MPTPRPNPVGSVRWVDLTVPDAERLRDFYNTVVGWRPETCDMGGYSDFNMTEPATGKPAAGVCHARGVNEGLPQQWLVYVTVADVDEAAARCQELGGQILRPPTAMGAMGRYCVIRDPAGAVLGLHEDA